LHLAPDGQHYISTAKKMVHLRRHGADFNVMARQKLTDPNRQTDRKNTAWSARRDARRGNIQKNRSKCGVRGTWRRASVHDVHVPLSHLLHQEAGDQRRPVLPRLRDARCPPACWRRRARLRAIHQVGETRFQFHRPLADFELISAKVARMAP